PGLDHALRLVAGLEPLGVRERQPSPHSPAGPHPQRVLDLMVDRALEPKRQPQHERLRVTGAEAREPRPARLPAHRERAPGPEQVAEVEPREADRAALALHPHHALEAMVAWLLDAIDEARPAPVVLPLEAHQRHALEEPEPREALARRLGGG